MDLLYRALGVLASVNELLWRRRVNFIPLSLVLGGTAVALLMYYATSWEEAIRDGSTPQVVDIGAIPIRDGAFVRTSGLIAPEAGYAYGEQESDARLKNVKMEFLPLVDAGARKGVFVQVDVPGRFGGKAHQVEVTGMLRPMREFLARELRPVNYYNSGIPMLRDYVLVADDQPVNLGTSRIWVIVTVGYLLTFSALTLKRNVIFRPSGVLDGVSTPSSGPITTLATGTFHLDKHRKHFITVPTALGTLETGDTAAFANVDASSNFLGVTYAKRAGIWVLPIAQGSVVAIEHGTLYFGRRTLPSVRFEYREPGTDKTRTAILSLSSGSSLALSGLLSNTSVISLADVPAAEMTNDVHLGI
jgi:hypothetical protein